ncbi:MAG: TetR family transcriptional regulator [Candidatus Eremiobacteraeota bacterium]|nr:TetR family transcriptional regulator [Candidatus Eremiobacteraeota bacterium]
MRCRTRYRDCKGAPPIEAIPRRRAGITPAREEAEQAFLDAAERLLVSVGYAGITTRKVAEEAGLNHGLVHYYFGSMQELLLQVLERFTDRLVERQREMYAAPGPFIEKWRTAMRYLDEDEDSGYAKIWYELQAMGWNDPEIRKRVARITRVWYDVIDEALTKAMDEYGLDRSTFSSEAIVTLVGTFNMGIHLQRLSGVNWGHRELLRAIDGWLVQLEAAKAQRESAKKPA